MTNGYCTFKAHRGQFWRCQAVQDPSLKTFDSLKELANLSPALHSLGNYGFGHDIL